MSAIADVDDERQADDLAEAAMNAAPDAAGDRDDRDDQDDVTDDPDLGDPDDDDDDDEPGVNRPGPASEVDIEAAFRKLEKEAARHANRVAEIMDEGAAELVVCELCHPAIPGFRFPGEIDGAQLVAVKTAIGIDAGPDLKPDTYSRVCDGCAGWGNVSSGSRVAREATLRCRVCKGRGWVSIGGEREAEISEPPEQGDVDRAAGDREPLPDLDAWGTPIDHPEYGVSPQYRRLPLPTFEG